MAAKTYPTNLLEQASEIIAACMKIDPNLTAGDATPALLSAAVTRLQSIQGRIITLEQGLIDERSQRDACQQQIWDIIKRLRASVKGCYGDDSTEYELVGGTRASNRKRPTRKAQA